MSEHMTLVLGNRTYSSWSLRGWLLMARTGLRFEEEMHWLDAPGYRDALLAATGGIGTVPTLRVGERIISESLAIAEYAAEIAPEAGLWPEDPMDRAEARSLSARMHAGLTGLRAACPMNLSNRFPDFEPDEAVQADLALLESMWKPCLAKADGPFLFGAFGAVDCMFAPVATRIDTFCLPVSPEARAYVDAVFDHPLMQQWINDARKEEDIERQRNNRLSEGWFTPGDWPILAR